MAKVILVLPDLHCPYQDDPTVAVALKVAKDIKPDTTVFLGDVVDGLGVSTHIKESIAERSGARLKLEFDVFNALFDKFYKYTKSAVITKGNHDERLDRYADEHPEVAELVQFDYLFNLKERRKQGQKIKIYKYNECHREGKLYMTHGTYTGDSAAKKTVTAFQRSIIVGHTHTYSVATYVSPIDVKDRHTAYNIGCMCNINPGYMRNKPNAWVHMFAVAYIRDNGTFNVFPIGVFDGRANFNGKEYVA